MSNPNPNISTRFQPGRSGNPAGKPRAVMAAERLRQNEAAKLIEFLHVHAQKSKDELKAMIASPTATVYECMNGQLLLQASSGNLNAWQILTDRMMGKNKEVVENTTATEVDEKLDEIPRQDIAELLRKRVANQ